MARLSHFDADGKAAMVDVSAKDITARTATAEGSITMAPETLALIEAGGVGCASELEHHVGVGRAPLALRGHHQPASAQQQANLSLTRHQTSPCKAGPASRTAIG